MQENEDKFDTTAEKTPIKKQNSKHEAIESEDFLILIYLTCKYIPLRI